MPEMYEPILIVRESVARCENARLVAVAHGCQIEPEQALTCVLKMWAWARRHATNGVAEGVQPPFVDKLVGVPGFAKALVDNRWLTRRTTGIEFPEWDKYLSSDSSAKALANARLKRHRDRKTGDPPDETLVKRATVAEPPTPPVVSGGLFGHLPEGKALEQNWKDYCQHRSEKNKKGWTKTARERNQKKVADIAAKYGTKAAIECIATAIECGWTGIFPPKNVTEHDLQTQQASSGEAETKSRLREMGQAERDELLADFRRTVPAKEQAKDGAFGRWVAARLTPSRRE